MPSREELYAEVLQLRAELSTRQAQIEWLQRQLYGGGKGEKLDKAQMLLKLEELEKLNAEEQKAQKISYERRAPREKRPIPAEKFAHPVSYTHLTLPTTDVGC